MNPAFAFDNYLYTTAFRTVLKSAISPTYRQKTIGLKICDI